MTKSESAYLLLIEHGYSCVAVRDTPFYTSTLKGIAPLMSKLLDDPNFFKGAGIADKVIGKSAAMLLLYAQAEALHAEIISEHACKLLDDHRFPYTYTKKVPYIINQSQTGMCPMENSVLKTEDPRIGFEILKQKYLSFTNKTPD